MFESVRGKGRTSRMLHEAVDAAYTGKSVLILCASERQRQLFHDNLKMRGATEYNTGHYRFGDGLVSTRLLADNAEVLKGGRVDFPGDLVLADHFALEMHAGWAIREWLRQTGVQL